MGRVKTVTRAFRLPSVPALLLRGTECRACGRPGAPETLPCPWCGERAPLSRETGRELVSGLAAAAVCTAAARCCAGAAAVPGFRTAAAVAAALALAPAAARCPEGAEGPAGGGAGPRTGLAGSAAALAASSVALVRAFAPGPPGARFAAALFAFAALAALRAPVLPPLAAPTLRGRFAALAAGSAAAALPLLSAAVPAEGVPEFGVAAFCALARTAVSLGSCMAVAAAALAAAFSSRPAAFALAFALGTAFLAAAGGPRDRARGGSAA